MFRYVGFSWDESNGVAAESVSALMRRLHRQSENWTEVVSGPGLRVLCTGARNGVNGALALTGNDGVVLGTVFDRTTNGAGTALIRGFSADEAAEIWRTQGRCLVEKYWGNYVAIMLTASTLQLLRGPMSSLPCYAGHLRGIRVIFSHLDDYRGLGASLSVNWQYIVNKMRFRRQPCGPETGLVEVFQVRAGEHVHVTGAMMQRTFPWNPFEIAASDRLENPAEAVAELRGTTQECVRAWASCHDGIVHRLSGGVDSSIVLACLKTAPAQPEITCLNYYSEGSDTDERQFARTAAIRAGCRLIEAPRNSDCDLEPLTSLDAASPNPSYFMGYLETSRAEAHLGNDLHATALCSGVGGDQLFYQSRAAFGVGDYIHRHGIGSGLPRIAYEAARLERRSVWDVLRTSIADQALKQRWHPDEDIPHERRFVAEEVFRSLQKNNSAHPWMDSASNTPSGKRFHICTLTVPELFYYDPLGFPGDPEQIAPLFSQPLVELCLRIPTYVLTHGGWDRSIARRAFEGDVPREIIWRRGKGGVEEHIRAIMERNLPLIRAMLLDGLLVERRLIDRQRVEAFLSLRPSRVTGGQAEIFEYLSLEAWLRSFGPTSRAAAA